MRYEVVYTMGRPATPREWAIGSHLVKNWLDQERAAVPRRFENASIRLSDDDIVVQMPDSEDLIVERAGTTPIWSAEANTVASSRILAGVMLCMQYACSADAIQLSSEKPAGWQGAARALTPVWGGTHLVRTIAPASVKADRLFYVDHDSHAQQLRDFFRSALEMDSSVLPDDAFSDTLLEE